MKEHLGVCNIMFYVVFVLYLLLILIVAVGSIAWVFTQQLFSFASIIVDTSVVHWWTDNINRFLRYIPTFRLFDFSTFDILY